MNDSIFNVSQIFAQKGVTRIVLSPGSRNAPLTLSFVRNPKIETFNIVDERSAGFIALGMSLKSKEPVAVCCTSGSALLNYAPAVAEAYYQQVPLIVISADRPLEWIDQRDGQTINQVNSLSNFVKRSFQISADLSHPDASWDLNRKINEAINLSNAAPRGPVHINIPFREPFYPTSDQKLSFDKVRIIEQPKMLFKPDVSNLLKLWRNVRKKLIVIGQQESNPGLELSLDKVAYTPIVADVIGNLETDRTIRTHDLFLGQLTGVQLESLKPELLITSGKSLISKNLKIFLRKYKPKMHWHFEDTDQISDTFKTLTHHFKFPLTDLLEQTLQVENDDEFDLQLEANYHQNWETFEKRSQEAINEQQQIQPFSEVSAYLQSISYFPSNLDLHLANSMAVRYANFFQFALSKCEVYANRGTSGIDSANGTAVGNAIIGERTVVLLSGDLSFFYDRNAFFHHHEYSKLKIIVFNNNGGGIFRMIKGPSALPELEQHFETRHKHSAQYTAMEFGFDYFKAKDSATLEDGLVQLFNDNKTAKLLEVFTDPETNHECLEGLKAAVKASQD